MKKTLKLTLVVFLLLILSAIIVSQTSTSKGLNQPPYTAFNTDKTGVSLLFDTLVLLQYPIEITFSKISEGSSIQDIQLVIQPDERYCSDYNIDEMLEWVHRGGRLVFLSDVEESGFDIGDYLESYPIGTDGIFSLYQHGMGEIFTGPATGVSNVLLKEDRQEGYILQQMIDIWGYETIYFNEYYHGFQQNPNIWKTLPAGFKMIIYQLLLVAIATIWFLGKRFGKPVPYYEEIEREENEYVKALSILYRTAGMSEVIVANYYQHFITLSARYFNLSAENTKENILTLWESKTFSKLEVLKEVDYFIKNDSKLNMKKRADRKQFQRLIKDLNMLTVQIKTKYDSDYK